MSREPNRRVTVAGRSWESHDPGLYCFEAVIDGLPIEVQVSEDVAFDFLKAWTPDRAKCLEILRLHRADLARMLERQIVRRRRRGTGYVLTWRDTTEMPEPALSPVEALDLGAGALLGNVTPFRSLPV